MILTIIGSNTQKESNTKFAILGGALTLLPKAIDLGKNLISRGSSSSKPTGIPAEVRANIQAGLNQVTAQGYAYLNKPDVQRMVNNFISKGWVTQAQINQALVKGGHISGGSSTTNNNGGGGSETGRFLGIGTTWFQRNWKELLIWGGAALVVIFGIIGYAKGWFTSSKKKRYKK